MHGFPVEEGVVRASFIAAVSDPAVELSLQSPSGAIGPDSPAFSEEAEGLVKVYRLEAPASGDWSVVLALPGGTGDPASYRVEVWADARLSLLLSTSRGLYLPGEAAELEAILQAGEQPVTGGEATAIITTPGGGTAAIPLVESGDGIYSLSYSPEDRGRYGVQVTASGEHEGVEYTRQSTTTFWVVGGVPLQGAVRLEGRFRSQRRPGLHGARGYVHPLGKRRPLRLPPGARGALHRRSLRAGLPPSIHGVRGGASSGARHPTRRNLAGRR